MSVTFAIWLSAIFQVIGTIMLTMPMFLPKNRKKAKRTYVEGKPVDLGSEDNKHSKPITCIGIVFLVIGICISVYAGIKSL